MKTVLALLFCLVVAFACVSGSRTEADQRPVKADNFLKNSRTENTPKLEVSFIFHRQSGMSSNQFAVWIENAYGSHIKTLYTTRWTAEGGWKIWDVLLPDWKNAAQLKKMSPKAIDTISGATPPTGVLIYRWNCKTENGETVPAGEYRYFIEGNLRWANRVLYTGKIIIGDSAQQSKGKCEYFSDYIDERNMITKVMVKYYP
jgi:hypothetical protein